VVLDRKLDLICVVDRPKLIIISLFFKIIRNKKQKIKKKPNFYAHPA